MLRAFRISLTPTRPYESGDEFPIRRSSNTKLIANAQLQLGAIAKSKGMESRISMVGCATNFPTASLPTIRASRKNRMQLRHAAALALVMWVLVVPAKGQDLGSNGYWLAKFDTQDQCQERRTAVRKPDFKSLNVPINANLAGARC